MLDADVIEQAICRTFAYTGVVCSWNDAEWSKFVTALVVELTRAAGWAAEATADDGEEA